MSLITKTFLDDFCVPLIRGNCSAKPKVSVTLIPFRCLAPSGAPSDPALKVFFELILARTSVSGFAKDIYYKIIDDEEGAQTRLVRNP